MYRIEKDTLGQKEILSDALYGIHSVRATENFPGNSRFNVEWYKAVGVTKLACYNTYRRFRDAVNEKRVQNSLLKRIDDNVLEALISSAQEVSEGKHFDQFIVPALQGGAGTSINMNINEIIANCSLLKTGISVANTLILILQKMQIFTSQPMTLFPRP